MPSPLVNIFVPTYEPKPEHVRQAVDSVLAQTYQNWTLLIHDDCSIRDVHSMIAERLQDPRIQFKRSSKRLGIGGNWNACVKHADGQFVQFLFQDDAWHPEYVARSVDVLQTYGQAGFTAANHQYQIEGEGQGIVREIYTEVEQARRELPSGFQESSAFLLKWIQNGLRPNIIGEPSFVMLHRWLIDEVGPFNDHMHQGLDLEYWLRCLLKTGFVFLPEELGFFRVHASGATAANQTAGRGLYDRLECFELLLKRLPPGELRSALKKTLRTELSGMIRKLLRRKKQGGQVSAGGSDAVFRFCLRHPLLLSAAAIRTLRQDGQNPAAKSNQEKKN